MILYSIVPADVVFLDNEKQCESNYIEMDYMGEKLQVTPLSNNQYVINRLISTCPKAFLDSRLQPGTIIKGTLNPSKK